MPDYQKGKIYKLWSPSKNIIYYGSTVETISQRLAKHLYKYNAYNNKKHNYYCSAFKVLECGDYKIELVEEYACNNKQQLERKEGEYIKNNDCINKVIAGRTNKEYRLDNADKIKTHKEANKEKIKEQRKAYREANKEKSKAYKEANKEKIREQARIYYLKNKNKEL